MEKLLSHAKISDYIFNELGETYSYYLANKASASDIDNALMEKAETLNIEGWLPYQMVLHFYGRL